MALSRLPKVLSTSGQKPTSEQKAVTNCPALFALLTPHPLVQCGSLGELCTGFVLPFCTAVVWKCHQCEIGCKQGVTRYNPAQVCKGVTDCSQNNPIAVIQRENLSNVSAKLEKVTFLLRFDVKKQAKFISHITLVWKGIRRAWLKTYLENHINRITEIYRSLRSLSPPNISSWVTEATQHHCTQGHSTPIGTRYEINCILTSHFHLFCHRFPISTSPCSHHSIPTRTVGSHKGWGLWWHKQRSLVAQTKATCQKHTATGDMLCTGYKDIQNMQKVHNVYFYNHLLFLVIKASLCKERVANCSAQTLRTRNVLCSVKGGTEVEMHISENKGLKGKQENLILGKQKGASSEGSQLWVREQVSRQRGNLSRKLICTQGRGCPMASGTPGSCKTGCQH